MSKLYTTDLDALPQRVFRDVTGRDDLFLCEMSFCEGGAHVVAQTWRAGKRDATRIHLHGDYVEFVWDETTVARFVALARAASKKEKTDEQP
jgi:hypothetical protein